MGRDVVSRAWLAGAAAVLAACSTGPVQCAPCPPSAYVELTGAQRTLPPTLVGDTVHVCVAGLPCEDLPGRGGTVGLHLPSNLTPKDLDGRTVTVDVTAPDGGTSQQGSAVFEYREQKGTCACSGSRAEVALTSG